MWVPPSLYKTLQDEMSNGERLELLRRIREAAYRQLDIKVDAALVPELVLPRMHDDDKLTLIIDEIITSFARAVFKEWSFTEDGFLTDQINNWEQLKLNILWKVYVIYYYVDRT